MLIDRDNFYALIQTFGWIEAQMHASMLLWAQSDMRRAWTPQEDTVIKFLRQKKWSFSKIGNLVNRPGARVTNRYQTYDIEKATTKADQALLEKVKTHQSKGAAWLETMIRRRFGMQRLIKEFAIADRLNSKGNSCRLDFYLPRLNLAFEYDGPQHDQFVKLFHQDEKAFRRSQWRDRKKEEWCKKINITLIRFSHKDRLTEGVFNSKVDKVNWGTPQDGK